MSDATLSELGPVDYVVVEFPAGATNFTGEMADELVALVEAGTIRVIDILILTKNDDGTVDAMELSDVAELGPLVAHRGRARRAAGRRRRRPPGRGDGSGIRRRRADLGEPVGRAVRLSRPPLRRPTDRRRTDPDPGDHRGHRGRRRSPKENDMPLRPARVGRVGVIGHPVAKTAVVAKAVSPGPSPVAKTAVVAAAVTPGRRRRRI